ncbi:MAG: ABC transporter permease subunit [Treponema sp.]|jgi:putative aldouronate transport system permease protein|nr:ABC transporter permease subunit [Treponema sp.]
MAFTDTVKRRQQLHYWRENYDFYLMLLPAIAFYIIFRYVPIYGVTLAFKDFKFNLGILKSPWIGLETFKEIFSAPLFWRAFRNTLWLNILSLVVGFPMPIIFALLLNEINRPAYKRVVQTISYMPYFFSWVIIYGIIVTLTAKNTGIFNIIRSFLGEEQIVFLTNKGWWLFIFIVSDIWKNVGWSAILYLSALSAIDPELYEAAAIDGAGRWKSMIHITLPGIKSTIIILLILDIGSMISIGLEKPFMLSNTMVNDIGSVLSVYVYNLGIKNARYSFSTAVGLFQSVINFALIIGADYAAKALGEDGIFAKKVSKAAL